MGCALVTAALVSFGSFAVATFVAGLFTTNFALVFAALPVSAFLTALGGEFVLAWPVDAVAWIVLSYAAARVTERRGARFMTVIIVILAAALLYGLLLGLAVEPNRDFFSR